MLIKLGILLVGFVYAGVLPYAIKRTIRHLNFDLSRYTLSFLSNKELYGKSYLKKYKRFLFVTAILNYLFFWLLSLFYDLGEHERYMQQIDFSFAFLTLLAFVPHNIVPYSRKTLANSFQRFIHNLLAIVVFLTIPTLIILFQVAIFPDLRFAGLSGLILIGVVIFVVLISIIKHGVNGITEILFINGMSVWSIYITILTFVL